MSDDTKKQRIGSDRRNKSVRERITNLYSLVYLPTYSSALGVTSIFPNGRNPKEITGDEIFASSLAAQDALSGTSLGKKEIREFAKYMVSKGIEVEDEPVTLEEVGDF